MKYAIYEPVYSRARTATAEEWRVRMEVIGTVEHCYSPDEALRAAKEAGFERPIIGPWKEIEQ